MGAGQSSGVDVGGSTMGYQVGPDYLITIRWN